MQKRILVVGGLSHEANVERLLQDTASYMQDLCRQAGIDTICQYGFFDAIDYVADKQGVRLIDARNGGVPLESYDLVLLRVKVAPYKAFAQVVVSYLRKRGVKCVNAEYARHRPSGKLAQMIAFRELGVPIPATIYASSRRLLELAPERLGFPMIVKGIHAAKGKDNHLVRELSELEKLLSDEQQLYIVQQYIPNDCDYRVLLLGDECMVIRRMADGDSHLNNISAGGSAEIVDKDTLPPSVHERCRTIMRHGGLEWAGIDVVQHREGGEYFFLEVNSLPQLDSGAFREEKAELLAAYLHSVL